MSKEYIATADTVEEAKAQALAELGVDEDAVYIEILEEPGKKLFGSRKNAVVKATMHDAEESVAGSDDKVAVVATEEVTAVKAVTDNVPSDDKSNELIRIEDLTDKQVDAIADAGIEHLKKLTSFLTDGGVSIEEFEGDEGEIILDISGEDVGVLIGRHGRTIDALQVIVSSMTAKTTGVRYPLSVDVEGYKHRRKQKVVEIARRAADRADRTGRPVALKSMSPHERRIVHMTLKNREDVRSGSEGSGSNRHVVVFPQ